MHITCMETIEHAKNANIRSIGRCVQGLKIFEIIVKKKIYPILSKHKKNKSVLKKIKKKYIMILE